MSLDSFFFLIKTAVVNFFKNLRLSLASITVLSVSMIVMGIFLIIIENVGVIISNLGSQNQVVIYLDENLSPDEITAYGITLSTSIGNIKTIEYKTKEEAMEEYKAGFGEEYQEIMKDLDPAILRNSYIIELTDIDKYDQTMYELRKIPGSANIVEKKEVIDKVKDIRDLLLFLSVWIMLFLIVISVFIIVNTVKSVIYARRDEIFIMKYCGAADFFIKLPFFIEGVLIGLVSGIIGYVVLRFLYSYTLMPILQEFGFFSPVSFTTGLPVLLLVFLALGSVVGGFGSVIPLKKYLEV